MIYEIILLDSYKSNKAGDIIEVGSGVYEGLHKKKKAILYDWSQDKPIFKTEEDRLRYSILELSKELKKLLSELDKFKKFRDQIGDFKDPYYELNKKMEENNKLNEKIIELESKLNNISNKRTYTKKVVRELDNKTI